MKKKIERLAQKNKDLMVQNETLLAAKEPGGAVVREDLAPEVKAMVEALKEELAQLKAEGQKQKELPQYALNDEAYLPAANAHLKDIDALLVKRKLSEEELSYWQKLKKKRAVIANKTHLKTKGPAKSDEKTGIPYYTLPAGSDLGHTVLLSALIGEVPVEGKLMQPLFPFSALVSRGDLMASNGVPLPPDISGMKVNGYAIGVGSFLDNISCVRAYVTSVLFTFQDGHFVVVGNEEMKNSAELVNNESLGYLTTPFGNPCIHGTYFTNAPRVLAAMMASGGIQSGGNALSQWQMSYFAGPNGGAALPTGSFAKYAGGEMLTGSAVKASDWLEKRVQGSFDMVFVPASFKCQEGRQLAWCVNRVSLHLTKTISIDKEPRKRVIHYGHTQHYNRDFSLR
ncbi:membrane protein [Legionella beliardensis]|uniref:Membrane protein n=1 Tax=Legionella beliardensis TaxID=91822 RepID=A0A378JS72_9GAMM|nr:membrane protein [Legionella beliardensis]